jgi:hypothetical protein
MKTIFTCLMLLVNTAHAAESMEDLLQKMQISTGADYIKARTVLVAQTQYKNRLADLLQQARWSKTSWRQDAYVHIAYTWMTQSTACQQFYNVESLEPENYFAKRLAVPNAGRELSNRAKHNADLALPMFLEMYLKTADLQTFSNERAALKEGVLQGLGVLQHAGAAWALVDATQNSSLQLGLRQTAFLSLGQSQAQQALPALASAVFDTSLDIRLRTSAVRSVAHVRTPETFAFLRSLLENAEPHVQRAAIAAVGIAASAWTHPDADDQKQAASDLLALLQDPKFAQTESEEVITASLVNVAYPPSLASVAKMLEEKNISPAQSQRLHNAYDRLKLAFSRL